VYMPKSLRPRVLHNYHNSIYGTHRCANSTLHDIRQRFWWPSMRQAVRQHVRRCRECQLAKGGEPHHHGRLFGRRHTACMHQLCVDLIGPITEGVASASEVGEPTYICTIFDPHSHMLWLDILTTKTAVEVTKSMVDRIFLEEGVPCIILTDNGSEFANSVFEEMLTYMQTTHHYTPARHPRANQAERANRFIGEQLRAMIASGARKKDWPALIKYIEFSYRRTVIPGTNVTPFMVARGRQPLIPGDEELEDREVAPPSQLLEPQVAEVQRLMKQAEKMVTEAREKVMAKNAERFDANHFDVRFEVGEIVRLFVKVPAVRDPVTNLLHSSKLKLRNSLYTVVGREGNMYELEGVETGTSTRAHVSQLSSYLMPLDYNRSTTEREDNLTELPESQSEMLKKVRPGSYIMYHPTDMKAGTIHVAEVLGRDEDGDLEVWYLYDHGQAESIKKKNKYTTDRPLRDWVSKPEWRNPKNNKLVLNPSAEQREHLTKATTVLEKGDFEIIVPSFDTERKCSGEFLKKLTDKADDWLRKQKLTPARLRKLLSTPRQDEK